MTNMEKAMIEAGIKTPDNKERIWRVVKETGGTGITYKGLIKRLPAINRGTISSCLNDMMARGMVAATQNQARGPGRANYVYTTDLDAYTVLPKVRVAKPPAPAPAPVPVPVPAAPAPAPAPAPALIDSVDHLTIAQARALYEVLRRMFETNRA
jgi:hypothetical protein